jgi:glycosyltransferase involved in cell wall biosynthesis
MLPSITISILTYARVSWLQQALASALTQTYAGPWDILVINDCPQQTLRFDHPRVRIVNLLSTFPSLGEKRNYAIANASGDWMTWLDDDDFLLPGHCDRVVEAAERDAVLAISQTSWRFHPPSLFKSTGVIIDMLFRRSRAHGLFPSSDFGEDAEFRNRLSGKTISVPAATYVYGWSNGVYHLSGQGGNGSEGSRFRLDAKHRLDSGQEPSGDITLQPAMRYDILGTIAKAEKLPYPHTIPVITL